MNDIEFDKWLTSEDGRQALIEAGGSQAQAMRSAWKASLKFGQNNLVCMGCKKLPDECDCLLRFTRF